MGKYDPLRTFLARQKTDTVELSVTAIERRLGALLPNAARDAGWWRAEAVQTEAWSSLGFVATLAPDRERVRFDRPGVNPADD